GLRIKESLSEFIGKRLMCLVLGFDTGSSTSFAIPDLRELCEQEDGSVVLDTELIGIWLADHDPSPNAFKSLALLGCSFALLRPVEGPDIYRQLLELSPGLRSLVTDEEEPQTETPDERDLESDGDIPTQEEPPSIEKSSPATECSQVPPAPQSPRPPVRVVMT